MPPPPPEPEPMSELEGIQLKANQITDEVRASLTDLAHFIVLPNFKVNRSANNY